MGRLACCAVALAACGSSSHDVPGGVPPGAPAPSARAAAPAIAIDAAPANAAPAAAGALTLVRCAPAPVLPGTAPILGTIGTGRYGTIGGGHPFHPSHGSGYGVGGGGRVDQSILPTVTLEPAPTITGALDPVIVRRYLKRNIQKIDYCYEKQLLAKPRIGGALTAAFTIAPEGTVADASATGVDPDVASCVADVIRAIEFPKPKDGGSVTVRYVLTLAPPGGLDPDDDPDRAPPPLGTPWLPLGQSVSRAAPEVQRALADATRAAVEPALAAPAAAACVAHAPPGSLRVMIAVDNENGASARTGGLGDPAAEACLDQQLARLTIAGPAHDGFEDVACELVHGAAAPLRLPPGPAWGTVEVTRDRIWYRGHYESTYPAGVPYLIVAARDARGAELVRALLKTAKGSEVAIVVDDGDRPPRLVAMRAGDAPTHEARVAIGTTALRACRGHDLAPATPPAIAAACKADGCDGAAIVSLDGDATVDALVRAVDDLGAAGLDRVAIAPAIRCP